MSTKGNQSQATSNVQQSQEEENKKNDTREPFEISIDYLKQHKIEETLDESVNKLMETRPLDPFGVLRSILIKKAKPPIIDSLHLRGILDSGGNPAIEVDVYAEYLSIVKLHGRGSCSNWNSGFSDVVKEVKEKENSKHNNKVPAPTIDDIEVKINERIKGMELSSLKEIDTVISQCDDSNEKDNISCMALTAASIAVAFASAKLADTELFLILSKEFHGVAMDRFSLPRPFFNICKIYKSINDIPRFHEFMIIPRKDISYPEQLRMCSEVYHKFSRVLVREYGVAAKNVSDRGDFLVENQSIEVVMGMIEKAIVLNGLQPGKDIQIGINLCSTDIFNAQNKTYEIDDGVSITPDNMMTNIKSLCEKFSSIIYLEDPLSVNDTEHSLASDLPHIKIASRSNDSELNAILLQFNKCSTVSQVLDIAKENKEKFIVVSDFVHETPCTIIADLAVAIGADALRAGACSRGERITKYTRLLQIYHYLRERNGFIRD